MARVPSKHGRDQALDFQGFLNDLQDWESVVKGNDKKMKSETSSKGKSRIGVGDKDKRSVGKAPALKRNDTSQPNNNYDINRISNKFTSEESTPDAVSEKEQGNEYFKQKKFNEAVECYSRSIALVPSAVAYANRAMAYLKLSKFQEAENDCTEALDLDDRYIKAYSRRATARKELGKLKGSVEDAEFAMRLEPQNEEIKKQYALVKSLHQKELLERASVSLRSAAKVDDKEEKSVTKVNGFVQEVGSVSGSSREAGETSIQENQTKRYDRHVQHGLRPSVQELASRAASKAMAEAAKNITAPNSAYQFEVSWRGLSGDRAQQARLLKAISPSALPQIFKNALSAPILIDIIKCLPIFFPEETGLAIEFLENLTKISRFDMIIMCLSAPDKADILRVWDELCCSKGIPTEYVEGLNKLRSRYYPAR